LSSALSQAGFEFAARYEGVKNDDYLFELDEYRRLTDNAQMMLAHIRVYRWSPTIFKRCLREWRLLRTIIKCDIFVSPQDDTPEWHKFVTAMGFKPFTQVICNDGVKRPLYLHRIKDPTDGHDDPNLQ
jgi:hypothetical protein